MFTTAQKTRWKDTAGFIILHLCVSTVDLKSNHPHVTEVKTFNSSSKGGRKYSYYYITLYYITAIFIHNASVSRGTDVTGQTDRTAFKSSQVFTLLCCGSMCSAGLRSADSLEALELLTHTTELLLLRVAAVIH